MGDDLTAALDAFLARHEADLIEFRRDLHAHPELSYAERRTTRLVAARLARAGLAAAAPAGIASSAAPAAATRSAAARMGR